LLKRADPTKVTVQKKRSSLIYEGLCLIIDENINVDGSPVILTVATDVETENIKFPDFIKIHKEILPENETYLTQIFSKEGFKMPEEDKVGLII